MTRLEEIQVKEKRLHRLMDEKGLDAVLLKKQPNFSWFTAGGYNMVGTATDMGMTSLLVTRADRFVIANRIEAPRMMRDEGLEDLGFGLLDHEWFLDREAELVQKTAGDPARVGADVNFGSCRNLDGDIKKLRYSLTENEVERYLFLGEKLSRAMEKTAIGIRPGEAECEVAGRLSAELWKDRIDITGLQVAADERAFLYRHPIPTTRLIQKYVMICANARYKGLITTITRIVYLGKPDPQLVRQFTFNCEIECRMILATKPGVPISAPLQEGIEAYKEFGYEDEWKLHNQGGAMGYLARDIRAVPDAKDLIEENQAICWNPSITGTKTEDAFIATNNGPLMITHPVIFPVIEYHKDGKDLKRPGLMILD
jgi:Xaa-Pro aminopeptidase